MATAEAVAEGREKEASQAVGSLLQCLRGIEDARKRRGVRYPLASTLGLCIVAFMCGRQNLTQVRRFGRDHKEVLRELGFPRLKAPSVPTLSRVLGSVALGELARAVAQWLAGMADTARKRRRCAVAAVDGKATRASGVHVLNVFLHDFEPVIWQAPVDVKQNEITVLKQSIADLLEAYPFLKILTGDAMFAGEPLCSMLIEHGRHYVFQIKADQKHLLERMNLVFGSVLAHAAPDEELTGEKKRLRASA